MILLFFGCKIYNILVLQVNDTVVYLAIRCLDEAEVVDCSVNAKRRNKTDVRTLRALNRTETTVVGIVNVTHLETCTLTRQTARTKSRETALVCDLSQRVGLIHELRQRVRSEERVDNARDGLCVDKIGRCEHLVVAHVHALTDGAAHTGKTDRELVAQLLTHCAYATVREVVDIIDIGVGVDQLDEILDNLYDVVLCEDADIRIGRETELAVDAVTTNLTKIITLV